MISCTMKIINITKGKRVIVDDNLYDYLNQFHWYLGTNGYAYRRLKTKVGKIQHKLVMQREIMRDEIEKSTNKSLVVDHINRDKLDNRKENLRLVTQSINVINGRKRNTNKSGVIGVCLAHRKSRIKLDGSRTVWTAWQATVVVNYKQKHLGYFKTKEEAEKVRINYMTLNHLL